jgi:hypothetical protein
MAKGAKLGPEDPGDLWSIVMVAIIVRLCLAIVLDGVIPGASALDGTFYAS